jgi:uncharacterized protein YodC (DUF2158 family)
MQTLPAVGEKARVAGIDFPLTVEAYDTNTRTAFLKAEHPDTGIEVLLPRVCLDQLLPPDEPATELQHAIGHYARLKSYGPLMTVTEIHPPLPDAPEGFGTTVVCQYFDGGELFEYAGDARTLLISAKRCAV